MTPKLSRIRHIWLIVAGYLIQPVTKREALQKFFNLIRPITTQHELIRIGGNSDGGYLVPDDLEGIAACFSPGVSNIADFELDMAKRNIPCFLADYSVDSPPLSHPLIMFEKKHLGTENNDTYMTLENWVSRNAPGEGDLLLQMDIEFGEFTVLFDSSPELLKKFRIMVIEFHEVAALYEQHGYWLVYLTFEKLLRDFEIVHIHPNNCRRPVKARGYAVPPVLEITFLRKDRITEKQQAMQFPHPLDAKNVKWYRNVVLPECWYAAKD